VDVCSSCNGLWLDKGELERLGAKLPSHRPADAPQRRTCPRCLMPMDLRDAHPVQVDICWGCGGLYLDAGELETLANASGAREKPALNDDTHPGMALSFSDPAAVAQLPSVVLSLAAAKLAAGAPISRACAPPAAPRPVFWCDLCRRPSPVADQVVGERLTVCGACAKRQGIRHDPAARRKAEADQWRYGRNSPDEKPSVLEDVLRVLFW
jgi:Zn-finger nucleic acid-binding protein